MCHVFYAFFSHKSYQQRAYFFFLCHGFRFAVTLNLQDVYLIEKIHMGRKEYSRWETDTRIFVRKTTATALKEYSSTLLNICFYKMLDTIDRKSDRDALYPIPIFIEIIELGLK